MLNDLISPTSLWSKPEWDVGVSMRPGQYGGTIVEGPYTEVMCIISHMKETKRREDERQDRIREKDSMVID